MSYGGNTTKYKIPYPRYGDVLDSYEEFKREQIVENQLFGAIYAQGEGHGVIREGVYATVASGSGYYVTLVESKTQNLPTLEAFVNQIYIRTYSPITWTAMSVGTNYIYAELIETTDYSSVAFGDVTPYSSLSAIPPEDAILLATLTISGTSAVLDTTPEGKYIFPSIRAHMDDSVDPHGETLSQTTLVASGVTVMENIVVRGNSYVQGNEVVNGSVQAATGSFTTVTTTTLNVTNATFSNLTVASGVTINGASTLHGNMTVASGVAIDGRDVSADGATLDAHIANVSNPHATTAAQAGALPLTGGTLTGNVFMSSGTSIDGVDMSTLQPLYAGPLSNADSLHMHTVASGYGLPFRYIGYSPIYGDTVVSGNSAGTLSYTIDSTYNTYLWASTGASPTNRKLVLRTVVPEDFSSWSQLTVRNKVTAAPAQVDVTMLDTAGASVSLTGGSALQNTSWTNSTVTMTGGTWTPGSFFTLMVDMTGAVGQSVYIGDLVFKYIPY